MKSFKKFIIAICLLFLQYNSDAQMRQVYVDDTHPGNEIYKISFYSASHGYVAFRDWIGYSADSGHTFSKKLISGSNVNMNGYNINTLAGFSIIGVKAIDQNTLLVYGDYGFVPTILYSSNGGDSYSVVYYSQYNQELSTGITDMIFPSNGSVGYAIDADRILKTYNGGVTWNVARTDPNSCFDRLVATDDNNVFVISDYYTGDIQFPNNRVFKNNKLLATNNAGTSWNAVNVLKGNLRNISFISPTVGWMNIDQALCITSNGGASWTIKNNTEIAPFHADKIQFTNASTGYALVGIFDIYKTTDSGKVWEPLPRDNYFYNHNDLQIFSTNQLWVGGSHGFLELSTNAGGSPFPKAYFQIDTLGNMYNQVVKLKNFSKPGYQFKWYVNNVLIDTAYHTTYKHNIYGSLDSIKLVVNNGIYSDSITKYQSFWPAPLPPVPVISNFSPSTGYTETIVSINGTNLTGVTSVSFGGVPATSFTIVSPTQIKASVGTGASGNISVTNISATVTAPGFNYITRMKISSVTPTSGAPLSTVIITGTNFNPDPAGNVVRFGSVKAAIISASSTQLTVKVPYGASQDPITVSASGITVNSNIPFFITFDGSCGINAAAFSDTAEFYLDTLYGPNNIITSDLDGDGRIDILSRTRPGLDRLIILRNTSIKSHLSFAFKQSLTITEGYGGFGNCVINDMDADGKPDMIMSDVRPFSIYKNTSIPGIISFAPRLSFSYSHMPGDMQIEDLDGDGLPEVFGIDLDDLIIFKNNSENGVISFAASYKSIEIGTGGDFMKCRATDIDGDGKKDILVTFNVGQGSWKVSIFRNTTVNGNISFDGRRDIFFSGVEGSSFYLEITDFDLDGKMDMAVIKASLLCIARNLSVPGSITFDSPQYIHLVNEPSHLNSGDLDGDGKPEIVLSFLNDHPLEVLLNISTSGNIQFGTPVSYGKEQIPYYTYNYYSSIADFDLDGKNDIASVSLHRHPTNYSTKPSVAIYRNTMCSAGPVDICTGGSGVLTSNIQGAIYQWQQNTANGFVDIYDNDNFTGTNTSILQLVNVPSSWYGYQFRCRADNSLGNEYTLHFSNYWTGKVSNDWNDPNNWSCKSIPDGNTDVIINGGTLSLTVNGICRSIKMIPGTILNVQAGIKLTITQ